MVKKRMPIILSILGIYTLLVTGISLARSSPNYSINPDIVASSGGMMSSTSYSLDATSGQMTSGSSSSTQYRLTVGYWEGGVEAQKIYLPVVLKQSG